ncbi:amidohydrolase [Embleya sp. NPDC005971]|uniref:amidohydrolase n=1 Tax=Embleya sp. NPDC005971 TaxID=3156724 RepID=UPI0033DBEDBE
MRISSLRDGAIVNANVHTMDPARPVAEAVAWRDGRITLVGTSAEVLASRPSGSLVDAHGGTVTPGLIDSHTHPIWGAELARGADLGGLTSFRDVLAALRAEADATVRKGEQWVFAWNLDYAALEGRPIRGVDFTDAVHAMPTVVMFHDLHTGVATDAALAHAGIDGSETFADQSVVVVDADGRPTGELREPSAYKLLLRACPQVTRSQLREHTTRVLRDFARTGLTGGVVMDGSLDTLDLLAEIETTEDLPVRLDVALWHEPGRGDDGVEEFVARRTDRGRRWRTGMIKLFLDGVVETGTAWLYEPDTCGHSHKSYWTDRERFADVVSRYAAEGFQIATHAIGDRAVGEVVEMYRRVGVLAANGAPHRIEHIETLTDADLSGMGRLGATASMQPLQMQWRRHDRSDKWSSRLGPDRASRAYRTRDMLDLGIPLALGSDWPVAPFDPRVGMAWAQLRRPPGLAGRAVFEPHQVLRPAEALHAYTVAAAKALGDTSRGRVVEGMAADLTCFGGDPLRVPADELPELPVLATIVDGGCSFGEERP